MDLNGEWTWDWARRRLPVLSTTIRPDGDFSAGGDVIHVGPISLLLMLRVPIFSSDDIPGGRLHPYLGAGPALFVSIIRSRDFFAGADFSSADASIGFDVRGGVKVHLLSWLAVFAEYRHTQFDAKWDDELGITNFKIKTELATHHVNLGVGFHF